MSSQTNNLSEIVKTTEEFHLTTMPLLIPPLQLPSVDSILSNFRSSFPAELLDRLASILTKSIEVIRRNYESSYRALYSSTQSTQDQKAYKLRCAYELLYQRTVVSHIQNLMTSANQEAVGSRPESRDSAEPKPKLRTRFRQEYVSFLEQYFQSNAYPSNTERAYLAQETKMSDRQIEVWFQNHRNRARREGKVLRRTNLCVHRPVTENHIPSDFSGYESESSSPCSDQEVSANLLHTSMQPCMPSTTMFDVKAPAYAFPMRYSEGRSMNKAGQLIFSADLWMRKAKSATPTVNQPMKLEEFITLFSKKLTIQDTAVPRRGRKHDRSSGDSSRQTANPWYTATTTFAPRAPYFALVRPRSKYNRVPTEIFSLPTVCPPHATTPLLHSCSRPSTSSSSSSSADESSCNELITPPSSPSASVLLLKALPDWTTILESVAA